MTTVDRDTFARMARAMAATNGYTAMQSSDWYISDGDQIDWMYGRHRIFSFTMELYPPRGSALGHYPPDEKIAAQTRRNRAALLYAIDLAGCPYRASGSQVANCGLLYDDLELDRGWTRDPFGDDTATGGAWARGNPQATSSKGPKQLGDAASGSKAFITGLPIFGTLIALLHHGKPVLGVIDHRLPAQALQRAVFSRARPGKIRRRPHHGRAQREGRDPRGEDGHDRPRPGRAAVVEADREALWPGAGGHRRQQGQGNSSRVVAH